MTINKEIKNWIDNLKKDDEISYNWDDYILYSIEDEIYELASTTVKEKFIYVTYDELFDNY